MTCWITHSEREESLLSARVTVTAVAVLTLGLAGCTGSGTTSSAARTADAPSPAPRSPAAAAAVTPIPYSLLTHCGIDEARIGSRYFEADLPLTGDAHNAPTGWDTPFQDGTMTLLSSGRAVFHDDRGHEVFFHVRRGATAFTYLCD
jgi:hypothetical protein